MRTPLLRLRGKKIDEHFLYDEHTPAQAKKQAGRESFLRISSGRTLPSHGDHELALDVALQPQKKRTPHLRSARSKLEALNLPHGHSPPKRPSLQNRKTITKNENRHLQIKHAGCILRLGEIKELLPKTGPIIRLMRPDFRLLFPSLK